jgi:hypothetical protein
MAARPEVLLVAHDASRTGAPILAQQWLRWAAADDRADVSAVLLRDGPLRPAFEAACPTRVRSHRLAGLDQLVSLGSRRHGRPGSTRPIVVANTLAAWPAAARRRRSRLVVWVHELDGVAARLLAPGQRDALIAVTDHFVAEGDRVAEMLVDRWHVPPAAVSVVDSSIPAPVVATGTAAGDGGHGLIGIGSLTPRKGPDAFVAVLAELARTRPALRGAWLGGPISSETADLVRHDRAAAGLGAQLDLVGEVDDVGPWLPPDGVLLHPAREDPAPVAVLEAASAGVAVVTWDTGGAAGLLRWAGLGHLVAPAGDLLGLARRAAGLLDDPGARAAAGATLQAAVAERTTDRHAPRILDAVLGRAASLDGGPR